MNYLEIESNNITLLGWKIEEPLVLVFNAREVKILNLIDDPKSYDFKKALDDSILEFQVLFC